MTEIESLKQRSGCGNVFTFCFALPFPGLLLIACAMNYAGDDDSTARARLVVDGVVFTDGHAAYPRPDIIAGTS